jgi:hypothetical protein
MFVKITHNGPDGYSDIFGSGDCREGNVPLEKNVDLHDA